MTCITLEHTQLTERHNSYLFIYCAYVCKSKEAS